MTLRFRLAGALVLLTAVGLTIFGIVTYRLYADAQWDQLDEQLLSSRDKAAEALTVMLVNRAAPGTGDDLAVDPAQGGPSIELQDTYAELRTAGFGQVVVRYPESLAAGDRPELPDGLADPGRGGYLFTVGSVESAISWRVLVAPVQTGPAASGEYFMAVATPTTDVEQALDRLLLIEAVAATVLLMVLALGAWLIIRHGLRPLERMASTAQQITDGDLSQRVTPNDPDSEVGRLGLALNTMLDEVEAGFERRDETERQLRQFLADAAHELRTPLTSIRGFAELFRLRPGLEADVGTEAGPEQLDEAVMLRRIEQESARMGKLIDDLLLLAHLDQRRPPRRSEVDLTVLAADTRSDALVQDASRSIGLDAPEPVVVEGDADHLRQALGNLMTNALRHTPDGTPIEIRVTREGETAMVQVRDHGPGLSDDALAHVFDRFWQADPSRSSQGVGLGLPIVASIAAEHEGEATAANAPDGPGAVFTLRIPGAR